MLFKKKHKEQPLLIIRSGEAVLYSGLPEEMPIPDNVIVKRSTEFFNDPTPCYIHKSAVRIRLSAELVQAINTNDPDCLKIAAEFTGLENITAVSLSS